jgi:nitrite reductase (NADH) large subunit
MADALHDLAAARLRRSGLWTHILIAWPIPVLLGFHVLKSYYF